ncbi:hypothetical protein BDV06DRAFT_194052 [Aspergillus oleicola]
MEPNPNPPRTTPAANRTIKREREGTAESSTPLSTVRRLLHNTRPEIPDRPPQQPQAQRPKHTVIVESRWTEEPVELPAELKEALEKWHDKKGRLIPPCKYTYNSPIAVRPSRAFDREGREVELTHFNVKAPALYGVAAARFPDGTVRLVSSFFTYAGKFGTYLKAWVGSEKGFEPEAAPSIIRRFCDKIEDIEFQPEAWTELDKRLKSVRPAQTTTPASQPSLRSSTRKRTAAQGSADSTRNKRHQSDSREDRQSSSEDTDSSSSIEETTDESDEEDDEKTWTEAPPRQPQQGSATSWPSSEPRQGPELLFKLTFFKFTVQHTRDFPVEECQTSKALFEKAFSFYKILDRNVKAEVLCCQLATRPEQHYLFAGSEGSTVC